MSSPLNQLADALPSFLLEMQDMKIRQDLYEARATYQQGMLAETIKRNKREVDVRKALEVERNLRGYYDPPEVKPLRDNISYDLRVLSDPNVALTLGDDEIIKRWKKVKNMQADYFGITQRDISVSMPVAVEEALAREKKPSPVLAAPPKKPKKPKVTLKSMQRGRSLLEAGLGAAPVVAPADATAVDLPPGFPDPSGLPENQTATFDGDPWIIRNGQWVKDK